MKHDITIKSVVSYKNNLLIMLYGIQRKRVIMLVLVSITLLAGKSLMNGSEIILYILIFLIIVFIGIPRVMYKHIQRNGIKYIEYFFDDAEFGYTTGECTITINRSKIRRIIFSQNHIEVLGKKRGIYIFASEEDIVTTEKLLKTSSYQSLCTN